MARWFIDRKPQSGSPSVNLRRLLPEATFSGASDPEISGCSSDLRRLEPGHAFVAVHGRGDDGHDPVARAVEQGATAVLVDRHRDEAGRLQVVVPDTKSAHARIVHALAGDPSHKLRVVGVTGWMGGDAVGVYLRSILEAAGTRCGSLGPSGWSDGLGSRPVGPEFPGAEVVASTLAAIARNGGGAAVVEFDERSLASRAAADGLRIEAAVVVNVAGTEETSEMRSARRRAFARLARRVAPGGSVVVNADDPNAELLGACNLTARRITFGLDPSADVSGRFETTESGQGRLHVAGIIPERTVAVRLDDERTATSALAAAAVAWSMGVEAASIVAGLESIERLPGRFELVDEGQPFEVRVDPARTPDELRRAVRELRAARPDGRIVCVVGAEGPGDAADRRALAEAVEAESDRIVFTSDNPRSEDPARIFEDLLSGCRNPGRATIVHDRREAIEAALALAGPGDAVLIAGKGRRAYQILADRVVPFDDRAVAARRLRAARPDPRRNTA